MLFNSDFFELIRSRLADTELTILMVLAASKAVKTGIREVFDMDHKPRRKRRR